jgi:hypothetical protein
MRCVLNTGPIPWAALCNLVMHHGVTELDLGDDDDGTTDNSFEDKSLPDDLQGLAKLRVLNLIGLDCLTGKCTTFRTHMEHPSQCYVTICFLRANSRLFSSLPPIRSFYSHRNPAYRYTNPHPTYPHTPTCTGHTRSNCRADWLHFSYFHSTIAAVHVWRSIKRC